MLDHVIVTVSDLRARSPFTSKLSSRSGLQICWTIKARMVTQTSEASELTDASFSGSRREGLIPTPFTSVLSLKVTQR